MNDSLPLRRMLAKAVNLYAPKETGMSDKPREWYIKGSSAWPIGGSEAQYPAGWLKTDANHVIEYSAYKSAQDEIERLQKLHLERTKHTEKVIFDLIAERAKSAKLVEALKAIQTTLGRAPAVNLDARNGFELTTDALKDFPTKSGESNE